MKIKKMASVFCVMILLLVCVISTQAFAETKVQDGLEVDFNSEKEEYSKEDNIVTMVTIKNTNSVAVKNMSIESFVPDDYKISTDSDIEKNVDVLNPGDTVNFKITYEPTKSEIINENVSDNEQNIVDKKDDKEVRSENSENITNGKGPKTGDTTNIKKWVGLLTILCGIIIACVMIRKKTGKKIIPFVIIISFIVASNVNSIYAEEVNKNFISATTVVKVNDSELTFEIKVKYDDEMETEGLKRPDNPTEIDNYYWDNSKVISVIDVNESQDILNETEVISLLKERGFTDYPITYEYTMNGEYEESLEAEDGSDQKHPMYETLFISENGDVWSIFVINGSIFANPASFNVESDIEAQVLYSESNKLTSYTVEGNNFYVTIPYETSIIVKQINRIDATELNKIVCEEIVDDEK